MNTNKLIKEIVRLHNKWFIPRQYSKEEIKDLTPITTVRISFEENHFYADAIFVNVGLTHKKKYENKATNEFVDGSLYEDECVGDGETLKDALKNLLKLTKKSVKQMIKE